MAVVIPPEIIKEIAEYLESGMLCWYHIPEGKLLWAPDPDKNTYMEESEWKDVFKEIKKKKKNCIQFDGLDSREEFRIMQSFAENEVNDPEVQKRLVYALNQRKPFMHFKSAIHYDSDYLDDWYAYKSQCYINHVKDELDRYNGNDGDDDEDKSEEEI